MRFLADHNLERAVTERLRAGGHDVLTVAELAQDLPDEQVLAAAERDRRILVTNDKDFAELAFFQHRASVGIVLVRMPVANSDQKALRLAELIADHSDRLRGALTVVAPDMARRRPFPV